MKKEILKWLLILVLAIAGGVIALKYGLEQVYVIMAAFFGIALLGFLVLFAVVVLVDYYLAKHPESFSHEIKKRKEQRELEEELDKRFE